MTHTPPVPDGNTSPYPIQEAPHAPAPTLPPVSTRDEGRLTLKEAVRALLPIGTAVAVSAALAGGAAYVFAGRKGAKTGGRGRKKA